ncbi:MAG: ABC transporter ATP-binding protein/permease [Spirochaetes bacterium]|nr:ABC transporter ATP-binding protein/permease [Spirochaetota bacterium]MBU1082116.1 ABC transporter ATP-binding protein/permease [Spirochaetota bacterium]
MLKEFKTLVPYLRRYRWRYALGLLCLVAVDAAQLLLPQYLRRAVDSIAAGGPVRAIVMIGLSMALTAGAIASGRFLWRFFIHGASRRIETALRDRLFARLMTLPTSYFHGNSAGDIMARATNDMQAIRMATGMAFVAFVDGAFMSVAILAVMFVQNPGTTLLTIAPLPLITVLIVAFGRIVGKRFKRVQELYSEMSSVAQETLQGIRVVQSFVKEDEFARRFSVANDGYKKASMGLVKVNGLFFPLISFLAGLTTLVLVVAGGAAVIENRMTPGSLAAMLAYLEMLIWPMLGAGFTVNMIQRGAASLKRVNEVLDTEAEPRFAQGAAGAEARPEGGVSFRGLSLSYPGARAPALDGITIDLPAGKTLGVLGKVGSGKSSLCKTLARIVEPPRGAVLWGGVDVGSYPLEELRSAIGFVPQDSFLFSASIRENVLFSDPDLPEERFERAVAISALDRDKRLFSHGWDTVVGERGLTLSGGQKQRVAIARAVVRDPELLVLDDALSAVDTETEESIIEALIADRAGKTTIIVSNRVSTLRRADIVAVLDSGRLSQLGAPASLAAADGFYAEIAALQALSAEPVTGGEGR